MGHTLANIRLCNPVDESKFSALELLVDTGSTYTWIKHHKLEEIGIRPREKVKFRTIDNRAVERYISEVVIECIGRKATTIVAFATESDNEVLGLHALEGLRLEVDPVSKQLREVEAVLALRSNLSSAHL